MGRSYNAATPIVDDQTIIVAGQGVKAFQINKKDDSFAVKELWTNPDINISFNTPVLKDGSIYGLSGANSLFCLDAKTGKTLWTSDLAGGGGRGRGGFGSVVDAGSVLFALTPASELIVFKPSDKEFSQVAKIKVAQTPTYSYPVVAGNRVFIKDQDAVTMYTVE